MTQVSRPQSDPDCRSMNPTVLVADDEAAVRDLVRQILEPQGFQVRDANSGSEVLIALEHTDVDLVILDLAMPGMEGIETLRAMQLLHPGLRVLVISGIFGGSLLPCAKLLGASATLKKPFSCASLVAEVRALMEQPNPC